MGEQIPMDTIKGFVSAVWQKDGKRALPVELEKSTVTGRRVASTRCSSSRR
jgi:hypothetical protein